MTDGPNLIQLGVEVQLTYLSIRYAVTCSTNQIPTPSYSQPFFLFLGVAFHQSFDEAGSVK